MDDLNSRWLMKTRGFRHSRRLSVASSLALAAVAMLTTIWLPVGAQAGSSDWIEQLAQQVREAQIAKLKRQILEDPIAMRWRAIQGLRDLRVPDAEIPWPQSSAGAAIDQLQRRAVFGKTSTARSRARTALEAHRVDKEMIPPTQSSLKAKRPPSLGAQS